MADISTVTAKINGVTYNLTYNSSSGKWEGTATAPALSSYNQQGGYYSVEVTATDAASNSKTVDASDATLGNSCRLTVKEKVVPVISISTPAASALLITNTPQIVFDVTDNDSGVKLSDVTLKIDSGANIAYNAAGMSHVAITNGYRFTYTPQSALSDGAHTIYVNAKDNDGNAATQASRAFAVDTVAPTLNLTSPVDTLLTNQAQLNVAGTTNDEISSPVTIAISLNGNDQGTVEVNPVTGEFSKSITLVEGNNTIVVTATDAASKSTSVTRTVTLSTTLPVISAVEIIPNPADAGATLTIKVTVAPGT